MFDPDDADEPRTWTGSAISAHGAIDQQQPRRKEHDMTETGPLATMLDQVVKTGQRPSAEQIKELKLRSTNARMRTRLRHQVSEVCRQLATAVRDGVDVEDVDRYVSNAIRELGGETGDHHHDDALPGRGQQFTAPAENRAEAREAAKRLAAELRHSAGSRQPISDEDLAHLEARPGVDAEAFRAKVRKASERVARLASTGAQGEARQLSTELGYSLAADLAPMVKPDPGEAARRPDGSYDPSKLADMIPR